MKLKQLLSPAVLEWNLAHEHLPDEQLIKEFKKWSVDNENMINESVERNLDKINECIERGKHRRLLLESEGGEGGKLPCTCQGCLQGGRHPC